MIFVRFLAILYLIFSVIVAYFIYQHKGEDSYVLWLVYSDIIVALILVEWFSVLVLNKEKMLKEEEEKRKELEQNIKKLEDRLAVEDKKRIEDKSEDIEINVTGGNEAEFFHNLLSALADKIGVVEGLFFKKQDDIYRVIATFAYYFEDEEDIDFKEGEGINGQVVKDKKILVLSDIPKGFAKVYSGLGESYPKYIIYWPVVIDGETKYLAELATFTKVNEKHINLLRKLESHLNEINFQ